MLLHGFDWGFFYVGYESFNLSSNASLYLFLFNDYLGFLLSSLDRLSQFFYQKQKQAWFFDEYCHASIFHFAWWTNTFIAAVIMLLIDVQV